MTIFVAMCCSAAGIIAQSTTFIDQHSSHPDEMAIWQNLHEEIDKLIRYEPHLERSLVPVIAVALLDDDRAFSFVFGSPESGKTIFETGSLTKPLSAFLVQQALDSLGYTVNTSVCQFLPDSICTGEWQHITIRHLLEHTAGLPRFKAGDEVHHDSETDPYHSYDRAQLMKDLSSIDPSVGKYSYSHVGYAVLTVVFDRLGGVEAFSNYIFRKQMSIPRIGFDLHDSLLIAGNGFNGLAAAPWHCNAMSPALGMRANAEDLLRYIILRMENQNPLSHIQQKQLHKTLRQYAKMGTYKVQDGWFLLASGKDILYYHNGRTGGHHGSIAFIPDLGKGVVVLSNGTAGTHELSISILRMLRQHSSAK